LTPDIIAYNRLMADSFQRLTGQPVLPGANPFDGVALANAMFHAEAAIVSHGVEDDPVFRYGNAQALTLWDMDWDSFTLLPSRLSAEPADRVQADRDALLRQALAQGFVDSYGGVRISRTGKRFRIENTVLWNVVDADGRRHGQAALIRNWRWL
ncbi:MAG TPA: MEKHLA domain-containing protein, partial [Asticcacaulis sp.]|nr:MEKHLA domain-containing protein [Asticcacaulis sp.]